MLHNNNNDLIAAMVSFHSLAWLVDAPKEKIGRNSEERSIKVSTTFSITALPDSGSGLALVREKYRASNDPCQI